MLVHIVLFRRKAGIDRDEAIERAFVSGLAELPRRIALIRRWRLSANELERPTSWHYVLESSFDDAAALDAYITHPVHVAVVGSLRHYFDLAACDYTADP